MVGDMAGALDALNEIDSPRVDQVKIEGLVRSNRRQIHDYLGLKPGELLTAEKLERTRRRLEELPTSSSGKIRFDPIGGRATVTPIVFERQAYPTDLMDLAAVGARAIFLQELRVDISDVLGWGEVLEPAFRWDRNRRRGLLRMAMPAPGAVPGVLGFEGFWEHQTYDSPSIASQPFRQTRTRAGAGLSDWATSWLRLQGGLAVDHIDSDTHLELGGGVATRAWDDRFAVTLYAGHWFPLNGGSPFNRGDVVMSVRSTAELNRPLLTALAGVALASPDGAAGRVAWCERRTGARACSFVRINCFGTGLSPARSSAGRCCSRASSTSIPFRPRLGQSASPVSSMRHRRENGSTRRAPRRFTWTWVRVSG